LDAADEAYAAIPGRLDFRLPAGPWIKLYSFDRSAVLNAQLQSAISIADYADISGNTGAAGLAAALRAAAEAMLPRFDTGYWSLYSLSGSEAPLSYHDYVVSLLEKLASRTGDGRWREFADRFEAYESQPPALKPAPAAAPAADDPIVIYPDPQDGYLDTASFRFWLSKLSTVTLHAGGRTVSLELAHGSHTIVWSPGLRAPGTYHPYLTARGPAGNTVREAQDEGTPWLHLVVRLEQGPVRRYRDLGRRPLSGRALLSLPPGSWQATLVAGNSAHRATAVDLGTVTGRAR